MNKKYRLPTLHILLATSNWALTFDFQQHGILTSVDSDEPIQPPFKLKTPNDVQSVAKHS